MTKEEERIQGLVPDFFPPHFARATELALTVAYLRGYNDGVKLTNEEIAEALKEANHAAQG